MRENQFSNDKLFFYPERLNKILDGKIVKPVVYELSLSGKCNCSCQYCCCKYFHSEAMLSKKQIDIVINEIADNYGEAVTLTGGGEPMMNPHFGYCIRQLAEKNISIGIITNGLLLNDDNINVIASHASFCRISLDTIDEVQYKKLRGTSLNPVSLSKHLKKLVDQRNKYQSKLLIGAQIVYLHQSDSDIQQTVMFCKECGLDFLQIRPVDNVTGESITPRYEFYREKRNFLIEIRDCFSTDHFSVILNENKFKEYDDQNIGKTYPQCLGGNFTASIGHDMQVYYCCSNIGNPAFAIGDLETNSLHSILMSDKRKEMIEHPYWQFCQMQCRNHKMNKILHELKLMPRFLAEEKILDQKNELRPLHCEFL